MLRPAGACAAEREPGGLEIELDSWGFGVCLSSRPFLKQRVQRADEVL